MIKNFSFFEKRFSIILIDGDSLTSLTFFLYAAPTIKILELKKLVPSEFRHYYFFYNIIWH